MMAMSIARTAEMLLTPSHGNVGGCGAWTSGVRRSDITDRDRV
jgi:hypothetical protein